MFQKARLTVVAVFAVGFEVDAGGTGARETLRVNQAQVRAAPVVRSTAVDTYTQTQSIHSRCLDSESRYETDVFLRLQ